ncbi:hypothetical protein BLA29_001948 [Euroglyphus maynei]|uniref:Uncharacterized protein n=1 Tax=Euroglyphus maynei TaxID=6958 RepID=A0A1Y3BQ45_EURMA|nr:hypothetical protein BLA29_001948 [Euroglyphus maynei]
MKSEINKFRNFETWVRNELMKTHRSNFEKKDFILKNGTEVPYKNLLAAAKELEQGTIPLFYVVFGKKYLDQYFYLNDMEKNLREAITELIEHFAKAICLCYPDRNLSPKGIQSKIQYRLVRLVYKV